MARESVQYLLSTANIHEKDYPFAVEYIQKIVFQKSISSTPARDIIVYPFVEFNIPSTLVNFHKHIL